MALLYYRTDVIYSQELPVMERLCLSEKIPSDMDGKSVGIACGVSSCKTNLT